MRKSTRKTALPLLVIPLLLFLKSAGAATGIPDPKGYVNDDAGVLSSMWIQDTQQLIEQLKRTTGDEIGILTVQSTEGEPISDYAFRVFQKWGIGEKGKDNGVLIVVAVKDRKLFIATGYGVEPRITDGMAGEIRDRILAPHFRAGKFGEGLFRATAEIAGILSDDRVGASPRQGTRAHPPDLPRRTGRALPLPLVLLFIVLLVLIIISIKRGPYVSTGRYASGSGGGFGGGGFGGFGGGSTGGGGAGGSW